MIKRMPLGPSTGRLLRAALVLGMLSPLGCGDQASRMAGTIDLPSKKTGRPDTRTLAKEAKQRRSQGR